MKVLTLLVLVLLPNNICSYPAPRDDLIQKYPNGTCIYCDWNGRDAVISGYYKIGANPISIQYMYKFRYVGSKVDEHCNWGWIELKDIDRLVNSYYPR